MVDSVTLGTVLLAASTVAFSLSTPSAWSQDRTQLTTLANASGRPKECGRSTGSQSSHPSLWDTAREPLLPRYCDLLGLAHAKLKSAPSAALELASIAEQLLPGRAAPAVVRGRANTSLLNYEEAVRHFEAARAIGPRSIEDPLALHDMGLALTHTRRYVQALDTYRVLVPRLALIPGIQDRTLILLEAASVAIASGPEQVKEAVALLEQARDLPATRYTTDVHALLALSLDRMGSGERAKALIDELTFADNVQAWIKRPASTFDYLADPADQEALIGIVTERSDPPKAAAAWELYINQTALPHYADQARKHLEGVKTRSAAKPGARKAKATVLPR